MRNVETPATCSKLATELAETEIRVPAELARPHHQWGSEQAAHSDSIHMTTHPLGYMTAAWIALEEMTPDNGPLIYHPGSHKLPYLLNGSYDHGGNRWDTEQLLVFRDMTGKAPVKH